MVQRVGLCGTDSWTTRGRGYSEVEPSLARLWLTRRAGRVQSRATTPPISSGTISSLFRLGRLYAINPLAGCNRCHSRCRVVLRWRQQHGPGGPTRELHRGRLYRERPCQFTNTSTPSARFDLRLGFRRRPRPARIRVRPTPLPRPRTINVTLTVTDASNATNTKTTTVTVTGAANQPPVASFDPAPPAPRALRADSTAPAPMRTARSLPPTGTSATAARLTARTRRTWTRRIPSQPPAHTM